jgi:hypothetical protein
MEKVNGMMNEPWTNAIEQKVNKRKIDKIESFRDLKLVFRMNIRTYLQFVI